MLTDYHMHLQPDGVDERRRAAPRWDAEGGHLSIGWMRRYTERARARGVGEIAFTEHVHRFAAAHGWLDTPFWRDESDADLDAYAAAVVRARDEGLPVLLGIEMDWLPGRRDEIAALLAHHPFDLVLGSVHWLGAIAVDDPACPPVGDLPADEVWGRYLDALLDAVASGLFDVIAHPDLPKVFGHRAPGSARARFPALVDAVARAGVAIECSSAGLRKPVGELYPDPDLLAMFREAGVPATLASDAHRPEDVGRDYATAVAALRGAGYTTITRFRRRAAEQVALASWG